MSGTNSPLNLARFSAFIDLIGIRLVGVVPPVVLLVFEGVGETEADGETDRWIATGI